MPAKRGSGEAGTGSPAKKQNVSSGNNGSTNTVATPDAQISNAGAGGSPGTTVNAPNTTASNAGDASALLTVPSTPVSKAGDASVLLAVPSTPVSKAGGAAVEDDAPAKDKTAGGDDGIKKEPPEDNNKKLVENAYMLLEWIDSELTVVVVLVIAVAFQNEKWTPAMMSASAIGALMTFVTCYSLYARVFYKYAVALLVVLGLCGGLVTPDKALSSVEAMQKESASLIREFGYCHLHRKASLYALDIQMTDPDWVKKHGKFEPRNGKKDEVWNKRITVAWCQLMLKSK